MTDQTIADIDPAYVKLEGLAARRILRSAMSTNPYDRHADPRFWVWRLGYLVPDLRRRRRRAPRRNAVGRVAASRETFSVSRNGTPWTETEDRALFWCVILNGWQSGALAPALRRTAAAVRKRVERIRRDHNTNHPTA